MITIDGEYRRIPRKAKRKKKSALGSGGPDGWDTGGVEGIDDWDASQPAAQNTRANIWKDTSIGSAIFDVWNTDEYNAESSEAPTAEQIAAAQQRSDFLDRINKIPELLGDYGKIILIGVIMYFIAAR